MKPALVVSLAAAASTAAIAAIVTINWETKQLDDKFRSEGGAIADRGERVGGQERAERRILAKGESLERLHEDFTVPPFEDHGKAGERGIGGECRGGDQRQRRIAVRLRPPADRQPARRSEADAHPGETAGADIDEDPLGAALAGQGRDHRDQAFGMAAADEFVSRGDDFPAAKQRDRTGRGRGLDDERGQQIRGFG